LPGAGPLHGPGRYKFYQFTTINDCTRLRIMRAHPRNNQKTAIQFVDYVLSQPPFAVETLGIRSDFYHFGWPSRSIGL
jgi:hypothetical protein